MMNSTDILYKVTEYILQTNLLHENTKQNYDLSPRREVEKVVQKATLVDAGPLRAVVEVTLQVSNKSQIKQRLILDAASPYLACHTEVRQSASY